MSWVAICRQTYPELKSKRVIEKSREGGEKKENERKKDDVYKSEVKGKYGRFKSCLLGDSFENKARERTHIIFLRSGIQSRQI